MFIISELNLHNYQPSLSCHGGLCVRLYGHVFVCVSFIVVGLKHYEDD